MICSRGYKTLSDGHFEKKTDIEVDILKKCDRNSQLSA